MKIALVCVGLGRVHRGYERYTRELFDIVKDEVNITLFKGGGPRKDREVVLPVLFREHVPEFLRKTGRDELFFEQLSYSLSFIPWIWLRQFDLVHFIEPGLGNLLYHAHRIFGFSYRTLYTHSLGMGPEHCTRPDFLHEVSKVYYDEAASYGIDKSKMILIPHAIHTDRFVCREDPIAVRREYNIPQDKIILLSVSAIKKEHKRVDYLVKEVAQLDDRFFLVVAGHMEDLSVQELADRLLPNRYRFLYVTFEEIPRLYRLADLYVHTALIEGFPLGIVEAMAAGLPVVTHDSPHFGWLTGRNQECVVPMQQAGALANRLNSIVGSRELRRWGSKNSLVARERYDWSVLKDDYLKMYEYIEERR